MQRVANDRLWGSGRLVDAYANRILRPVEADILVRYRDALSGRVLELGSGAGRLTGYLAEIAAQVRGIDISPEMVAYSRRRYPRATFAQGDLRDPSVYGSTPWDAIVAPFNVVDVFGDGGPPEPPRPGPHVAGARRPVRHVVPQPGGRGPARRSAPHGRPLTARLDLDGSRTCPRWLAEPAAPRRLSRRNEPSYAILNDVAHDYAVLHYYITRDAQARQLDDHGFELIECLDLDGSTVAPGAAAAHCSELHYVAPAAAAEPLSCDQSCSSSRRTCARPVSQSNDRNTWRSAMCWADVENISNWSWRPRELGAGEIPHRLQQGDAIVSRQRRGPVVAADVVGRLDRLERLAGRHRDEPAARQLAKRPHEVDDPASLEADPRRSRTSATGSAAGRAGPAWVPAAETSASSAATNAAMSPPSWAWTGGMSVIPWASASSIARPAANSIFTPNRIRVW